MTPKRLSRDFHLLWAGESVSMLGSAVAGTALPLVAVVGLNASTFEVALLTAVAWLPWLLVGLPAGAWVDRIRKRPVMATCNAISMLVFASVPVAQLAGILTIQYLLAAAAAGGIAKVFFSVAYRSYLTAIVDRDHLLKANTRLLGSESVAQVGGPGLAGVLAAAFGPVTGVLADALSFGVSALCLAGIRTREKQPAKTHHTKLGTQVADGLRFVRSDPYLRVLVLFGATSNLALNGYASIQVVFLARNLNADVTTIGVVLALTEIGGIGGALFVQKLAKRAGTARAFLLCEVLAAPVMLVGPLGGLTLFIAAGAAVTAGLVGSNVLTGTFRQSYCPPELFGRITASSAVVNYGTIPLGGLLGGLLGEALGVRETMVLMGAVQLAALGILLKSPLRRHRDFPTAAARPLPSLPGRR
ncbi:MFS transporter [Amycolatopsis rhabdoformis]|uniref:MFS transporter n=1 Tax=Amycolatopsis rhabdoformis TaxID=1448059 RepID=A0ABZ1IQD2_9PSEU|nr:MFS transporter [Amycolatopsis rhabdoformis]WSE35288.1 MFS transporter [Amycolatopsis rhabdoformis]